VQLSCLCVSCIDDDDDDDDDDVILTPSNDGYIEIKCHDEARTLHTSEQASFMHNLGS